MDTFDPTAIATIGHNAPPEPPYVAIFQEIDDLYDEAKNLADGEEIDSAALADMVTGIHDKLHALGKKADELRVEEKRPLDEAVAAIQSKFNPYIQPKKGKVDLAKSALGTLLAAWRKKLADEKAAEAAAAAAKAEEARRTAQEAIRASAGNLAEREAAEETLKEAKALERQASRANKAATTGTGLRKVYSAEIADEEKAMDWAYNHAPGEFVALALSLANEQVRAGARSVPGFVVKEDVVASVGRA